MPIAMNDPASLPFLAAVENAAAARVRDMGLTMRFGWDFEELTDILRRTSGFVNPTFDPACRRIDPASIWLVLENAGEPVATTAFAYFRDGDLESHARAQSLWYDDPADRRADIGAFHALPERVEAPFTVGGAAWARQEWRGQSLPYLLNVCGRLHILKHLPVRNLAGFAMLPLVARSVPKSAYDYPPENVHLFLEGSPPPFDDKMQMYAMRMTREEAWHRLVTTALHRLTQADLAPSILESGSTTVTNLTMRLS